MLEPTITSFFYIMNIVNAIMSSTKWKNTIFSINSKSYMATASTMKTSKL